VRHLFLVHQYLVKMKPVRLHDILFQIVLPEIIIWLTLSTFMN
jgi:hypothetical protein